MWTDLKRVFFRQFRLFYICLAIWILTALRFQHRDPIVYWMSFIVFGFLTLVAGRIDVEYHERKDQRASATSDE